MKLKGEVVSAGLDEWVKAELKEGPRQHYDLGKFLFSVSTGTIGVIAAVEKLGASPRLDLPMLGSVLTLLISAAISLKLAIPRKHQFGEQTDLLEAYTKQVQAIRCHLFWWAPFWTVGAVLGGWAIWS